VKTDASATTLSAMKLAPILKRHTPATLPPAATDPIETLVESFLLWEASTAQRTAAIERIRKECVDFNELRVCLPEEIISILGSRYPFVDERATRMRRSLNDLYKREHKVSLDHVTALGKREQRHYVENLDGMLPFVSSRILLFHFGQAMVPVDDQLAELFREQKLVAKEASTAEIAHALVHLNGKQSASLDESMKLHFAMTAYVDAAWEKDPKAMQKNKQVRLAAQMASERAARREAEKAAEAAAKAAEAAAKAEAERVEQAKAAAKAAARAEAKAARQAMQQAAKAAQQAAAQALAAKEAKDAKVARAATKAAAAAARREAATGAVKTAGKTGKSAVKQKKPAPKAKSKAAPKPAPKPKAKPAHKLAKPGKARAAGKPATKGAKK